MHVDLVNAEHFSGSNGFPEIQLLRRKSVQLECQKCLSCNRDYLGLRS